MALAAIGGNDTYDGTEKSVSGITMTVNGKEYTITDGTQPTSFKYNNVSFNISGVSASAKGTDAGTYPANITGEVVITDAAGNDVTSQFAISTTNASLVIGKRTVTMTSASDTKEYDGKALTNDTVTATGFVSGEGATYIVTGSQTNVGKSENKFTYTLTEGTKAENYEISKAEGILEVTDRENKFEVTVKANSSLDNTYDGIEKSVSGFETLNFTIDGVTFTVSGLTAEATRTDAGSTAVNVTGAPVVTDAEGIDVTAQFTVKTVDGELRIEKRAVTMTSASDEKEYDGNPLTNDTVTATGFVSGEGAEYTVTGEQTYAGSSANTFTYKLTEGTKAENYTITTKEGTLTVKDRDTKYEITVEANSDEFKYDGTEKSVSGLKSTEFMVNGHKYTVSGLTAEAKATDAGSYTVEVTGTAVVKDSSGVDVTKQFAVNEKDGTLEITRREITLTSATASKPFDGGPLTNDKITVSGDGFAKGESATYIVTGSQTAIGSSENTFKFSLDGENFYGIVNKLAIGNYIVTSAFGTLTVTAPVDTAKYAITVVANSAEFDYNATPHSVSGAYVAGCEGLTFTLDGITYTVSGYEATGRTETDAGNYTVNVTGTPKVVNQDGLDVTKAFVISTKDGTLKINPKAVTMTSASASKAYDKTPLTKDEVTATGFIGDDGATYIVTGSQTLVGTSGNKFTYELKEGTKAENYAIRTVEGELTVTDDTAPENVIVKTAGDETYALGETVTFEIKVTNIYAVAKNITITEQEGVTITGPAEFENVAPGMTVTTTATYKVTEEDIKAGTFKNTAKANFGDVEFPGDKEIDIEDPKPALTVNKVTTSTPTNGTAYALGETITYKITVTNTGNVTLTGVVVEDELTKDSWTVEEALAPGAAKEFTAEYVVTEADIIAGKVVNTATAASTVPGTEVTPDTEENPTVEPDGKLTIVKVATSTPANGTAYALGETITYKITVTNTGNLTITDITVTDDLTAESWPVDSLAPGASEEFETSYTVAEADVMAGHVLNVATATGTSPDPDKPTPEVEPGEEDEPVETKDAKLFAEKKLITVNGEKAENVVDVKLGDKLGYTIEIVNNGNVTISAIEVNDPLTGDNWTIDALAPGKSTTFTTKEYIVTEQDILAGQVLNTATAKGTDPEGKPVEETPSVTTETEEPDGSAVVNKTTTSTPADGKAYVLGETITYEISVTNTGNVTLTDITVTDELTGNTFNVNSLAPGRTSEIFKDSYTVTEKDILAGSVVNTATAKGTSPDPDKPEPEVTPGKEEDETDKPNPHITITKEVVNTPENGTAYKVGEVIKYSIRVVNDGNLTLKDIVVSDPLTGDTWNIAELAPDAEKTFNAEYTVTEADAENGKVDADGNETFSVVNTVTATGTSPDPDKPNPEVDPGEVETPVEPLYTLTIHYQYTDGRTAAPDYVDKLHAGELFGPVYTPEIAGYTPDYAFIRSNEYGMPAQDVEITVVFTAIPAPPPPATIVDPVPTPTPTPTPPGGGAVEENEQGEVVIVPVVDPEVPLADTDLGHRCCILHFLIMVVAMIVLAFHTKKKKDHREEIAKLREELDARMIAKGLDVELE